MTPIIEVPTASYVTNYGVINVDVSERIYDRDTAPGASAEVVKTTIHPEPLQHLGERFAMESIQYVLPPGGRSSIGVRMFRIECRKTSFPVHQQIGNGFRLLVGDEITCLKPIEMFKAEGARSSTL